MSATLKNAIRAVNRTALMVGSISTLAISSAALAQEEGALMEEIEVTGIRGSLKAAIDTKRFSNAVVDSVSAEDIGKFPDKNIAESLQRVPGVTISRGFTGEGNEVSIRGVNPELTSVLLNGQYVASTQWFSQNSDKRSFNMDLMPSEMVAGIDVYKSPTAQLDEGGVGGTVIVKTRKPLDLDPMTVYASAEAMQNDIDSGETAYGLSGMVSWKNDAETFGILGSLSTLETIGRANKAENYWEEGWDASGVSEFNQDRQRDAFDITAQFKPTDALEFGVHYFNVSLDAENTNQNFLLIPDSGASADGAVSNAGGRVTDNGVPTIGTAESGFLLGQDTNSRKAEMNSEVLNFDVTFEGQGYTIAGQLGMTEADGGNGGNYNGFWGVTDIDGVGTVDYNFDGTGDMTLAPTSNLQSGDNSWQAFAWGSVAETELSDEEVYAQVDLDFEVDMGPISNLKTGLKLREHEFESSTTNYTVDFDGITDGLAQFSDGTIKHSGSGLTGGTSTSIARLDDSAYKGYIDSNKTLLDNGVTHFGGLNRSSWNSVEEDITALYLQADFEGENYRGNVGMRYVETDVTGNFYLPSDSGNLDDDGNRIVEYAGSKDSIKNEYSDWLPSMNFALDLSDDLILRMSAARVMSRPGYSQMAPVISGVDLGADDLSVPKANAGNPTIDPFRATQMDIGLEWYFADEALASAAIFSKDIASFITTGQIVQEIGGRNWEISVPEQGRGGKIEGFELQYQQTFGNFGVVANYTYVDGEGESEDGTSIDLPGTSQNSYNLTGFYENDIIAARLAYNYRDDFLGESLGIGGSTLNKEQDFLDGSLTWHVTDNFDLSVEGVNLLGEETKAVHAGGLGTMQITADNGTRYYVKAAFRM